ncbi:sugar phosphate isomerase/epimerase family protein [Salinibacterium sp. ZJ454]|uniref:sugar phosphate isomerase/epimerase family protein n=1 Tax=Salinibacterium sp. ZJ454 TaxID=2708339 RepID=UPI0032650982
MMRRVLGVNTWVWASPLTDDTLKKLAVKIANMGFRAIELPVENPGDWDPHLARDLLAELGLRPYIVGAMAPGRNLVAAPASDIVGTQNYLAHCITVAGILGAPVVAGPFTAATGRTWRMSEADRADAYQQLRSSLTPVVNRAERAGVTLAIEPLNRYETSLINTVEQALDALGPLLGTGLGLMLDTYHLNIEEKDVSAAVELAGGHIAHVQVSGTDRGAVGDDHFAWPAFLDALDAAGYRGPLNLESFTGDNDAIATATSIWRPLASSQDALARRTLDYLTRLQNEREAAA